MTGNLAIHADGLRKSYPGPGGGESEAVRGLGLSVAKGEFFGLLGPNGAGKSTTIGMLTTMVRPTAGRAEVCGLDVAADAVAVKRRIGVVAQDNTLDIELTVAENLEFRGRYFGLGRRDARARARALLALFGLADRARARVFELSGGQLKRVMIARALVHRPDVLFLDEPTAGLDPQSRLHLWDVLRGLQAEGQTILLTTHHMEEAETLCDRLAVIDHGRVLACDSVPALRESVGAETVVTIVYEGGDFDLAAVRAMARADRVEATDGQVRVFAEDPDGVLSDLVALAAKAGLTVVDASQIAPSLETVFLTLTGREFRE
ncbi:ABC transporter ATP-binding protein [Streptomyces paromomycinus]|uniref:ABC-type xenobiotic transporter n=1 Tax=Streptomyces paromomycinus TaxID=92743 RepID=A0A401VV42_STREY|nr:ABC transporter ATP-binding protein [Streptomyces paromomycinus]GCD40945.1 multidrug ABC transporter ATP-binding protein [Streptomyces paromomycinus]